MINFFRKIRKNLLNEGKTGRYLKYAIGEILLVVIGILIALQINNWNQELNNRHKERVYLKRLVSDLEQQDQLLDEHLGYEHDYSNMGQDVLRFYATNKTFYEPHETLPKLSKLTERRTFNPIMNTFQELIATGNIELISNEGTKINVTNYYHELQRVTLVVGYNNIHIIDGIYQPEILKHVITLYQYGDQVSNQMNQKIFGQIDLNDLQATTKLQLELPENELHVFNVLQQRMTVALNHIASYESLKADTQAMKGEIETLLEGRQ
ncbi:MAG: hypothetical protein DWP95_06895 [Proteobacteria bacterium]|nr:MAG: hypothetical protein DWP95_06895 [Pseudomonadota bacterium]